MTIPPPGSKTQARRRQVDRSAETRRRLLDAAIVSLTAHGFAGASVERIVAGAGVTRGALNHHFAGKNDVIVSAMHEITERFSARLHGAFLDRSGNPDPYDRMVRALWEAIYGTPAFVARVEILLAARNLPDVLDLTRVELLRGHGVVHEFWRWTFASIGLPSEVARNHVDFALMSLRGLAIEQFVRQDPAFVDRALGMLAAALRAMMATPATEAERRA